jgi:hypothetical protein
MKNILKLEELAMLGVAIFALTQLQAEWWWYLALVLAPDISMIGYSGGNKTGAFLYNLVHHKAVAIVLFVIGIVIGETFLEMTGIILFGHSSMDRIMGYGLKTNEGFKYTHLGIIGKK